MMNYNARVIRHALLVTLLLSFAFASAAVARQPNIVVIVSDDLGFADVGFNGANDFDTPHFDALAASGVRFTNGYVTHPYCSPSRAGLITGRYQQRFGHENNPDYLPNDDTVGAPVNEVFLSKVLNDAGYRTAAIGKWHLGDAPRFAPAERGFDEFFGFSGGGFSFWGTPGGAGQHVERNGKPVPVEKLTYLTDDFSSEAVGFIERNREQPFFLYLAYNAVHAPNHAPQKYLDRTRHIEDGFRTVYAAMMVGMDEGIGRVIAALEAAGVRDDTLVFFVNDNGGRIGSDNRPLRGHKGLLYEGGVRVPFLLSWPAQLPAGKLYQHPVSALDVFPTAVAAAGAKLPTEKPLDGVDLIPYLKGRQPGLPHDVLFWRVIGGEGYAVRQGRYKLVKAAALDRVQLFDLESDLGERIDLSGEQSETLARLQRLYEQWSAELMAPRWRDAHPENVKKEHQSVITAIERALPPKNRR